MELNKFFPPKQQRWPLPSSMITSVMDKTEFDSSLSCTWMSFNIPYNLEKFAKISWQIWFCANQLLLNDFKWTLLAFTLQESLIFFHCDFEKRFCTATLHVRIHQNWFEKLHCTNVFWRNDWEQNILEEWLSRNNFEWQDFYDQR